MHHWEFYLSDSDRSTGWTNHGYVLQYVCTGFGSTPRIAWRNVLETGSVPEDYIVTEPPDVAIRANHKVKVSLNDA